MAIVGLQWMFFFNYGDRLTKVSHKPTELLKLLKYYCTIH